MKFVQFSAIVMTGAFCGTAMANVVTDAGSAVVSGVTTTGKVALDSTKQIAKAFSQPASISAELGSLGVGANIAWSANDKTDLVIGWTGISADKDVNLAENDSIINYKKFLGNSYNDFAGNLNIDVDFSNPYVGIKIAPSERFNRLTVGTGVIFQDNTFTGTLTPQGNTTIRIGSKVYDVSSSDVNVQLQAESGRSLAPYLTVGFKPEQGKKFGMFGELGAVYTGEWKTSAVANGTIISPDGTTKDNTEFAQELKEKLDGKFPEWYPIIKLGATYRFN